MAEDSDDKTEDPTQKRLDDAHEKGDVAKSQEVNTWFVISGATLVLSTFSGSIGSGILAPMRGVIANSWMIRTDGAGCSNWRRGSAMPCLPRSACRSCCWRWPRSPAT